MCLLLLQQNLAGSVQRDLDNVKASAIDVFHVHGFIHDRLKEKDFHLWGITKVNFGITVYHNNLKCGLIVGN